MKAYKVAVTGVESTGKSTLAEQLTLLFQTTHLTEYARKYLENLKRPYGRMDVLHIGQQQIMRQNTMEALVRSVENAYPEVDVYKPFFFDTELTVVKVWYETKYQKHLPSYLEEAYLLQDFDFYLLPYPDLDWEQDVLREAPDVEARLSLFARYEAELQTLQRPYFVVRGKGEERVQNAVEAVRSLWEKEAIQTL